MVIFSLRLLGVIAILSLCACAQAPLKSEVQTCAHNPKLQGERSEELVQIANADQVDRKAVLTEINLEPISRRDAQRNARVAEIAASACLQSAEDYSSAALVFLHGTTSEQIHQSFLWFKEAVRLGKLSKRWLEATAIDLYLVKVGHKQLFGTQLGKVPGLNNDWCIDPIEKTFPDRLRAEYLGSSLRELTANTLKLINNMQDPLKIEECDIKLKPTLKGAMPEIW